MPGASVLHYLPSLLKFTSTELVMLPNPLILCHPLLLLPSIFPSTRVFFNELVLHIRWPKYWSFSFNISPSNEYSGLISFRTDWFDLLAIQEILKSHLQHTIGKHQIFGLLMKVKEESEKVGLKQYSKNRSWHLVQSLHAKQMGKQWIC